MVVKNGKMYDTIEMSTFWSKYDSEIIKNIVKVGLDSPVHMYIYTLYTHYIQTHTCVYNMNLAMLSLGIVCLFVCCISPASSQTALSRLPQARTFQLLVCLFT